MRIVNKKRFISSVGMLILFITLIIMMIFSFIKIPKYEETYQKIIICEDDTLWNIAKKYRSTIEQIARMNGIENKDKIYPGQKIYIPKFNSLDGI